ncbi:MAG TPA: NnrS family protein [Gemmatimonadales bacterium]
MPAVLALGFRPFYWLASVYAALSIALWALQYGGYLGGAPIRGPFWHAHEMLFGYAIAVVAGFLFTAVRNWANRPTPTGPALGLIVALWLAGRILVFTPFALAAAIVNALFPLAVAVGIAVPLFKSGNRRNYFFVALLAAASVAVLMFHLAAMGVVRWPERASLQVGLDIVLFIITVVAGRVIPMFTNNGVPGAGATRKAWLEKAALATVLAVLAADALRLPAALVGAVAFLAAAANGARLTLWNPWRTLRVPLVWVLHAAYLWIPIHLLLRGLAAFGLFPGNLAAHALTIGVIGGMTIGMMTRTARGHTGRPLAADRAEVTAYALVQLAALVRVFGPVVSTAYVFTVFASATLWSVAFAIYAVRYWPILTRPRVDGKPG